MNNPDFLEKIFFRAKGGSLRPFMGPWVGHHFWVNGDFLTHFFQSLGWVEEVILP